MSDNGSAMLAAETTEGLARLGILHETTLPYAAFCKLFYRFGVIHAGQLYIWSAATGISS
jgi:hypothetical protein